MDKSDDGYSLRPVGLKLVQTVIAGAGAEVHLEPTEIDLACHLCGAATAIAYREGWLYQLCTACPGAFGQHGGYPDGILFGEPFPPAAVEGRTTEELFAAGVFLLISVVSMKMGEHCPTCSGPVETAVAVCGDHDGRPGEPRTVCGNTDSVRIRWTCTVCKYRGSSSPSRAMITHPAVVAFYHDHGIDVGVRMDDFELAKEVLSLMRAHDQAVLATDPLRVQVTVSYAGDGLRLTLDDDLDVLEVERGA